MMSSRTQTLPKLSSPPASVYGLSSSYIHLEMVAAAPTIISHIITPEGWKGRSPLTFFFKSGKIIFSRALQLMCPYPTYKGGRARKNLALSPSKVGGKLWQQERS